MSGGCGSGGGLAVLHLDAGEYTAVWRVRGDKPAHLYTRDHGHTFADRDALDAVAWSRLAERGLAVGTDPCSELADALDVLAAPDAEIDAEHWTAGATGDRRTRHAVVASRRGQDAVVAGLDARGGLWAAPVDADQLAAALLARLPTAAAWPGLPVTLPTDAVCDAEDPERTRRLRRAGVPRPTMLRLDALWSAPPRRVMRFAVARRDDHGEHRRPARELNVVDAEAGRVALVPDPTGRYLTLRPATTRWLCDELTGRLEALRRTEDR